MSESAAESKSAEDNAKSNSLDATAAEGGVVKKKRNRWGSSAEDLTTLGSNSETSTTTPSDNNASAFSSISGIDIAASIKAAKEAAAAAAAAAASGNTSTSSAADQPAATGAEVKKPRTSRFSSNTETALVPIGAPGAIPNLATGAQIMQQALTPEVVQQSLVLKMQLQSVTDRLLTVVADAARIEMDPDRSPSPPPKYDSNGKRTNTREIRMRESLLAERTKLIETLLKINPTYIPPPDFVRQKPVKRIFIPNPTESSMHNYIGLIIGPRGNTQKELEQKSGCKISIRGKGSVKDGAKGRSAKQVVDEEYDLHVHVTGDTDEQVAYAVRLLQEILSPREEDLNAHKQKQLRELALINGTLKEDEYCPVCGEKGHRQYECPHRAKSFKAVAVKCSICGDLSHPTRDCPLKQSQKGEVFIDNEYDSFMAELGGGNKGADSNNDGNGKGTNGTGDTHTGQQIISVSTVMTGLCKPVSISTGAPLTASSNTAAPAAGVTVLPTINMMDMLNGMSAVNPYAAAPATPAAPAMYGYAPGYPPASYYPTATMPGVMPGAPPAPMMHVPPMPGVAAPPPPPPGATAAMDPNQQLYLQQQYDYQQQYAQYAQQYQYPYGYQ